MATTIERIGSVTARLGEGPLWDPEGGVLYWVDSEAPKLWCHDPVTGAIDGWDLPGRTVGSLALRASGGFILAMDNGIHGFDPATGACELLATVFEADGKRRLNDGKTDAAGRFIVGSMDAVEREPLGSLYRVDTDFSVHPLDHGFIVSNGPCFSPDGRTLYHADSHATQINAYDYDLETGAVANKRPLVATRRHKGAPDGMTVDADGFIWSALIIAGKLARFAPDGSLDRLVEMPVHTVTSTMFGGPDLDVLYVTSMGKPVAGRDFGETDGGGLFAVHGLGVNGRPEPLFAG